MLYCGKFSNAESFYACTELVAMTVEISPWSSLVAVSHVDKRSQDIVRSHLRRRVMFFMGRFIPRVNQEELFDKINASGTLIVGALVRCMMSNHLPVYNTVYPNQLDLLVPSSDSKDEIINFLVKIGYVKPERYYRKANMVLGIDSYCHMYLKDGSSSKRISIILANEKGLLPALLMAPLSSHLFALSPSNFYCLYPKLFARQQFVSVRESISFRRDYPFATFNFGLWGNRLNREAETEDCADACPVVWRDMTRNGGNGLLAWGGIRVSTGDVEDQYALFGSDREVYMWKGSVGNMCCNRTCVNFTRQSRLDLSDIALVR